VAEINELAAFTAEWKAIVAGFLDRSFAGGTFENFGFAGSHAIFRENIIFNNLTISLRPGKAPADPGKLLRPLFAPGEKLFTYVRGL
jgi:hypothetical protein